MSKRKRNVLLKLETRIKNIYIQIFKRNFFYTGITSFNKFLSITIMNVNDFIVALFSD